ncbi:MAG: transglutaminase family protein [Phycisphaerales bacterium]|nr:transglutaminase family protein [Phycisphaerales bacterium]
MQLNPALIRLDCAALHLARDAWGDLDLLGNLSILDRLAEEVAAERAGISAPERYRALREVLVERREYRGDRELYYDPDNCYLNRVLRRKIGIPISLSIVWMEVGRRLKWPISGVSFPGHFLVRIDDPERFLIVDPFNSGQTLAADDCRKIVEEYFKGRIPYTPQFLEPCATVEILSRLLANLRSIYAREGDVGMLRSTLERQMALEPNHAGHVRELARLLAQSGARRAAVAQLEAFLADRSAETGADGVLRELRGARAALAALN